AWSLATPVAAPLRMLPTIAQRFAVRSQRRSVSSQRERRRFHRSRRSRRRNSTNSACSAAFTRLRSFGLLRTGHVNHYPSAGGGGVVSACARSWRKDHLEGQEHAVRARFIGTRTGLR